VRLSTRNLLVLASLGAVTALILFALIPFGGPLAAFAPPLYALVVGVYSVMPFLARRLIDFPLATTLVSFFAGLLAGAFSSIGYLVLVPLLVGSLAFDLSVTLLRRASRRLGPNSVWVLAGAVSGVALFLVSLLVFSPDDLVPGMLVATLAGRIAAQVGAALLAVVLSRRLARAGITR